MNLKVKSPKRKRNQTREKKERERQKKPQRSQLFKISIQLSPIAMMAVMMPI
jgi:hypothetical protein